MECVRRGYAEGHEWKAGVASWRAGSGAGARQHGAGDVGAPHSSRRRPDDPAGPAQGAAHDPPSTHDAPSNDDSFMNEMDEISYWVYTKRAPCLMNYDNVIKKQHEAAQIPKPVKVPSPKKKKRKLTLLDHDCVSVKKQQNVYFDTPQQKQRTVPSSCKSATAESDIDFNIKNTSIQKTPKRVRKQKSSRTQFKKNTVVTSTPLRRSQRRTQNDTSNTQLNISFDLYNSNYLNGTTGQSTCKNKGKARQRSKKSLNRTPIAETSLEKRDLSVPNRSKDVTAQKDRFEDLSDVSGFTANYIRSTKLHSSTNPHRSLRSKNNRNLVKESQPADGTDTEIPSRATMLVCVNKAVNASPELQSADPIVLNCSTDSSQNVMNLVTTKNNNKSEKVNKSTSLLKFVDVKSSQLKESHPSRKADDNQDSTGDLDISFRSRTSNSRYPKRQKKITDVATRSSNTLTRASLVKRQKSSKEVEFTDSERKENPDDTTISRTRSGRSLTLALRQPENSLIVYSNSTEKVSTVNTLNVGSRPGRPRNKAKLKQVSQLKHSIDNSDLALHRDSVRERSGFAACFSDSEDDSDALKQRKFFC
ncbi:hypothetical protein O0L34_g11684 [Tuta absoluta]|nr:hypothetical protein O0L34_g11684 [Tuta absoluta]